MVCTFCIAIHRVHWLLQGHVGVLVGGMCDKSKVGPEVSCHTTTNSQLLTARADCAAQYVHVINRGRICRAVSVISNEQGMFGTRIWVWGWCRCCSAWMATSSGDQRWVHLPSVTSLRSDDSRLQKLEGGTIGLIRLIEMQNYVYAIVMRLVHIDQCTRRVAISYEDRIYRVTRHVVSHIYTCGLHCQIPWFHWPVCP